MNKIVASGMVCGIDYGYANKQGEIFYICAMLCARKSGRADVLHLAIHQKIAVNISNDDVIEIVGEIQTKMLNGRTQTRVLVQEVREVTGQYNDVEIIGHICKEPYLRETPLTKRKITDFAVEIKNGKYRNRIYCIAWGMDAEYVYRALSVGDKVKVKGRLQSRDYEKLLDDGTTETRTAYEVSVQQIEEVWESEVK